MMIPESGDDNPPTSRRGKNTNFPPPSAPRAEKSGNNHMKKVLQRDSAKNIRCTTALSRRAPWGDKTHTKHCAGNSNTRLRYGRTGTSQYSPNKLELHDNGTVVKDDCDHERQASATKNTCLCKNQPSNAKNKVLLMELQEKFHSREKNLIRKESGTSRGSVLQEKYGWQWKGMWISVRGNS